MKEKIILKVISKLNQLDKEKLVFIEKAADSCLAVQTLEKISERDLKELFKKS